MIASTTPALLAEVAARLPTDGRERAKALAIYHRFHEPEDLEPVSPEIFLRMLCRAREDWEAPTAKSVATALQISNARKAER
jgi:hypothetical protein